MNQKVKNKKIKDNNSSNSLVFGRCHEDFFPTLEPSVGYFIVIMTELFAKDFFALTKKTLDPSHLRLSGDTFQAARMAKAELDFLLNKEHSNCLLSLDSPSAAFAAAAAGAANNCPDVNVEMAATTTTTTTRRENFGDAILKLFLLQKSFESCRLSFILFRKTAAQWSLFSKTPPFSS